MNDNLVKRLRELQDITEHCGEQSCDECENRKLCDKHDNKTLSETYKEAADAIEKLSAYKAISVNEHNRAAKLAWERRWIPVSERLPEEMDRSCGGWSADFRPSDDVLVWLSHEKRQSVAWYSNTYNEWTTVDENTVYCFGDVTHWMPLPEPPKEE